MYINLKGCLTSELERVSECTPGVAIGTKMSASVKSLCFHSFHP